MAAQARILKNPQEILPYLNAIKEAADANREALGFNPVGVYEDSIKKGKLWVAADAKGNYLGHIMLGGKPPQELRIFQIYVYSSAQSSTYHKLGRSGCCLSECSD